MQFTPDIQGKELTELEGEKPVKQLQPMQSVVRVTGKKDFAADFWTDQLGGVWGRRSSVSPKEIAKDIQGLGQGSWHWQ